MDATVTGVGLCLPQLGSHVTAACIERFCRRADELGYTSLWVQDHFLWPLEPRRGYGGRAGAPVPLPYQSVFAPTELLAAAATWTSSVGLGTSVLVAGNHWPASLASRLATIDQLSDGRLIVGLSIGWNAEEHDASGTDIAQRGARIDDFLPALLACWADDPVAYNGPFFTIPPSMLGPKPVQRPHPPLLSGMWSPAGLERTCLHYDGWNPAGRPVAFVAETVAEMNARRPANRAPLSVYHRAFVVKPNQPAADDDPVARLSAEASEAALAGFDEFIVECNFDPTINSPEAWEAVPDRYRPLLDAVSV